MYTSNLDLQTTVRDSFTLRGVGIHSGEAVAVTVQPACEGGIRFHRADQPAVSIPAHLSSLQATPRCTVLAAGEIRVATTEHLLSALWALGVDHARVLVEGDELPALDGSALEYVQALQRVGLRDLDQPREWLDLAQPVWVRQGDASILALPAPAFKVTYVLEYDHPMVGTQVVSADVDPGTFAEQVAPARTFGFLEWAEELRKRGLARGASLENTVVIAPDRILSPLRFADEFARHKILDMIGDLALLGRRLRAHVIAVRGGHALNASLVGRILELCQLDGATRSGSSHESAG
ncbi:MAG TPA: UDP-3-O-acyl-N-acetylglucosamine deacetylase [Armatimonadota bacterium]|nr:UDP-3-O-[3-hydroxymyristoyl] N-acetylglucosamine deacetylase [Armatimonadota bacterium]HOM83321.1 UDP-3-O-acyl-N-acetylglucosamine deacetylase [Armatimonadota bacterium]HPO74895.1 UDP-3-O-acyl-N-acetylglucosamine deacetylase [Armatimonadota bacterium]HPT96363.1 UDP-3-O-acyl-N-acetylglucosamine deacetylase [Armatimonadota bacterium]